MVRVQEQGAMLTNRQHKHPGVQLDGRKDAERGRGRKEMRLVLMLSAKDTLSG